jgi:hypothetical protein
VEHLEEHLVAFLVDLGLALDHLELVEETLGEELHQDPEEYPLDHEEHQLGPFLGLDQDLASGVVEELLGSYLGILVDLVVQDPLVGNLVVHEDHLVRHEEGILVDLALAHLGIEVGRILDEEHRMEHLVASLLVGLGHHVVNHLVVEHMGMEELRVVVVLGNLVVLACTFP